MVLPNLAVFEDHNSRPARFADGQMGSSPHVIAIPCVNGPVGSICDGFAVLRRMPAGRAVAWPSHALLNAKARASPCAGVACMRHHSSLPMRLSLGSLVPSP